MKYRILKTPEGHYIAQWKRFLFWNTYSHEHVFCAIPVKFKSETEAILFLKREREEPIVVREFDV